jgi:hypothetical protein
VCSSDLGYPVFLNGRCFLVGSDQSSLQALDEEGTVLWTYFFPAPLTGINAAGGLIIAGSLDGTMELLDMAGRAAYSFEPGGSRLECIYACALSSDGSKLALIAGLDEQRFLFLERSGDSYRVAYHESLGEGFRRPVHLNFIDGDRRVSFERQGGLGIFNTASRESITVALKGRILAVDPQGGGGLLFVITDPGEGKKILAAIRYPSQVFIEAPFKSESGFLGRRGSELYVGGGSGLLSFAIQTE